MFTTTTVLPVRSESEIVTLALTRSSDSPPTYHAALYTVGPVEHDPYAFSGRCTMGQAKGSASALFDEWRERITAPDSKS